MLFNPTGKNSAIRLAGNRLFIKALRNQPMTIHLVSGSMEPAIMEGERVVVEPIEPNGFTVGDILVYPVETWFRAHRLVRVIEVHGETYLVTKGDANNYEDAPIKAELVCGRVAITRDATVGCELAEGATPLAQPVLPISSRVTLQRRIFRALKRVGRILRRMIRR